ncbi:hypothetical protein ACFE04_021469 [Oxalis oulophora]
MKVYRYVLKEVSDGQLAKWPERLNAIPLRISSETLEGITKETFLENSELWKNKVEYYKTIDYQLAETGRYRNLLDMNAYLGGFAAAFVDDPVWVMNVVPVEAAKNTLGAIYERGLIGTYQNWCEMQYILLEMDRILRPQGNVIIREDIDMLLKIKSITDGMQWESRIVDHEKGPHQREKILYAVKQYWTAPAATDNNQQSESES